MTDKKKDVKVKEKERFEALTPEQQTAELESKEKAFLINGKKQYWHNVVYIDKRVSGLVYKSDVKKFFANSPKSDMSKWMSDVDKIQQRIDRAKAKMKKKLGI